MSGEMRCRPAVASTISCGPAARGVAGPISAGPGGSVPQTREQFAGFARELGDFYRSIGRTGTRVAGIQHVPISDQHVLARVQWATGFERLGDTPVVSEISYVVDKSDAESPRIVMSVVHDDEEEALRAAGLIG